MSNPIEKLYKVNLLSSEKRNSRVTENEIFLWEMKIPKL